MLSLFSTYEGIVFWEFLSWLLRLQDTYFPEKQWGHSFWFGLICFLGQPLIHICRLCTNFRNYSSHTLWLAELYDPLMNLPSMWNKIITSLVKDGDILMHVFLGKACHHLGSNFLKYVNEQINWVISKVHILSMYYLIIFLVLMLFVLFLSTSPWYYFSLSVSH